MRIASHLKMSVQRAQYEITSSEFLDWIAYLDDEPNRPTTTHYYLAQIAARITGLFAKDPNSMKIKDFILKFAEKEKEITREEAALISKSKWLVGVGYKGNKNGSET